jgi:hypothetical protein
MISAMISAMHVKVVLQHQLCSKQFDVISGRAVPVPRLSFHEWVVEYATVLLCAYRLTALLQTACSIQSMMLEVVADNVDLKSVS